MKIDLNTAEAEAVFAELERRLIDKTELMQDIGELMVESTRQNFVAGTSPDGVPWAPKSQTTIDAYAARGETVSLRPLIGPSKTLSTTIFAQPGTSSVAWGSNMVQAAVMQFGAAKGEFGTASNGSSIPWGNIPTRPFIGVGPEDEEAIVATAEEFLERAGDAG